MKKYIIFLAAFFMLSVYSCIPEVVFTEHQPKGFPQSPQFMNHYQGTFFCEGDNSIVKIEPGLISKEMLFKIGMTIAELEELEGVRFDNNELFVEGYATSFDAFVRNDSVFSDFILKDTVFNVALDEHIITEYNGHQILNRKIQDQVWEVMILSLDVESGIYLSEVFMPEDLNKLKNITPVTEIHEGDDAIIRISPSVSEFGQILREGIIFHACDHFIRLRQPLSI